MDELFKTPPSNPSSLQSARAALAAAERERDLAHENNVSRDEMIAINRAVARYADLVTSEERKALRK